MSSEPIPEPMSSVASWQASSRKWEARAKANRREMEQLRRTMQAVHTLTEGVNHE